MHTRPHTWQLASRVILCSNLPALPEATCNRVVWLKHLPARWGLRDRPACTGACRQSPRYRMQGPFTVSRGPIHPPPHLYRKPFRIEGRRCPSCCSLFFDVKLRTSLSEINAVYFMFVSTSEMFGKKSPDFHPNLPYRAQH